MCWKIKFDKNTSFVFDKICKDSKMNWYDWYMSWNFYHKFVFPYKMIKLFLVIFRSVKRFLENILTCFSDPDCCSRLQPSRLGPLTSRLGEESVDRAGRPTCTNLCTFGGTGTVDRYGRPGHLQCSLFVSVDRAGRPQLPNGHISDRWRSTGPVNRRLSELPTQL